MRVRVRVRVKVRVRVLGLGLGVEWALRSCLACAVSRAFSRRKVSMRLPCSVASALKSSHVNLPG